MAKRHHKRNAQKYWNGKSSDSLSLAQINICSLFVVAAVCERQKEADHSAPYKRTHNKKQRKLFVTWARRTLSQISFWIIRWLTKLMALSCSQHRIPARNACYFSFIVPFFVLPFSSLQSLLFLLPVVDRRAVWFWLWLNSIQTTLSSVVYTHLCFPLSWAFPILLHTIFLALVFGKVAFCVDIHILSSLTHTHKVYFPFIALMKIISGSMENLSLKHFS